MCGGKVCSASEESGVCASVQKENSGRWMRGEAPRSQAKCRATKAAAFAQCEAAANVQKFRAFAHQRENAPVRSEQREAGVPRQRRSVSAYACFAAMRGYAVRRQYVWYGSAMSRGGG